MPEEENHSLDDIARKIAAFCRDRDWEQFHNPKNLSMALAVEASELMEIFQWLTLEQSQKQRLSPEQIKAASEELADVIIYSIRMAQTLEIDLLEAIVEKIDKNKAKYPINKIKGKATLD